MVGGFADRYLLYFVCVSCVYEFPTRLGLKKVSYFFFSLRLLTFFGKGETGLSILYANSVGSFSQD
jgi:hypothetical protein